MFIELTLVDSNAKQCFNVMLIQHISPAYCGKWCLVTINDSAFTVVESYEVVKKLVRIIPTL